MRLNGGADLQSLGMAGSTTTGTTGTSTGTTATTLTNTGAAWSVNQWTNFFVLTGSVYGIVLSNTATVLTIDQWYSPGSPGNLTAAATPAAGVYTVLGASPASYMALTANSTAVASTDTVLTGEITTAGGGLRRKLATYSHTTGAASYTLTATFTANSTDVLPVTVAKVGIFNSLVPVTGTMEFEDLLSSTAPFNAVGDQAVITLTVNI